MRTPLLLLLCLGWMPTFLLASEDSTHVKVFTISEPIVADGILDEPAWQSAEVSPPFWQWFPSDTSLAEAQTEIYMLRDDEYLYVAAKCYSKSDEYIITSLKRDFQAGGNDNVSLLFDPFNDRRNAFLFGLNPYGVKREAIITEGGGSNSNFTTAWDNKWEGDAKIYDGYYICEFAIPFTTLRFLAGGDKWGFNSYRFDTQENEWSVWTHIPQNQSFFSLGWMGDMYWEEPLVESGSNFTLIPYSIAGVNKNYEDNTPADGNFSIGGDAKIAVTSGMNLDLTVNPDFSQVEVDRQVTNLSRFELFFPERRQFFIENSDLFGSFGDSRINPFFSRRIGITRDTSTGANIQNPIYAGARLSGKLTEGLRLGVLNMQSAQDIDNDLPSYNYSVVALQKQMGSKSSLGAILVNKQHFSDKLGESLNRYNRVLGVDYNLLSKDNVWQGKIFNHYSISEDQEEQPFSHGMTLKYDKRLVELTWEHAWIGEGYNAEVGFVPRKNIFNINPEIDFSFYPKNSKHLVSHGPGIELRTFWKPGLGRTDEEIQLFYDFNTVKNQRIRVWLEREYTYLFDSFDPTRTDAAELPEDTEYQTLAFGFFYSTDQRRKLSLRTSGKVGEFFNGKLYQNRGTLTYRYQPYGSIAFNYSYNHIDLPSPYAKANLILIGPRIDMTFTKKLFLTTFIQYNNQIENLNINARLQWRYKPVSDFYLVYTDNYATENFAIRSRAVVAKVTYWLNT